MKQPGQIGQYIIANGWRPYGDCSGFKNFGHNFILSDFEQLNTFTTVSGLMF